MALTPRQKQALYLKRRHRDELQARNFLEVNKAVGPRARYGLSDEWGQKDAYLIDAYVSTEW